MARSFYVERKVARYKSVSRTVTIESGKPIRIRKVEQSDGGYGCSLGTTYEPGNESFNEEFKIFACHFYGNKNYEDFIETLDKETLEEYFELKYVPKI